MERLSDLQWISSVFDEAAVEFEVVSLLTPNVLLNENLRDKVGEEIAYMIHEHLELELRYRSLLGVPDTASLRFNDQLFDCSLQLCDSLRALCRRFRAAPHLLQIMGRSRRPLDVSWYQVLQQVGKFFHMTRTKLLSYADDENSPGDKQLDDLNATIYDERQREHELTKTLTKQRSEHTMKMSQCTANIKKLQREVQKARAGFTSRSAKTEEETKAAINDLNHEKEGDQIRLAQVQEITKKVDAFKTEGVERENKFRKELRRIYLEIEENIAKYDDAMIKMTAEIESLTTAYETDMVKLKEMRMLAETLTGERETYEEQIREMKRRIEEEERMRNEAAVKIQSLYRGWKTRRDLVKAKSKAKAKGKGKKKSK